MSQRGSYCWGGDTLVYTTADLVDTTFVLDASDADDPKIGHESHLSPIERESLF